MFYKNALKETFNIQYLKITAEWQIEHLMSYACLWLGTPWLNLNFLLALTIICVS